MIVTTYNEASVRQRIEQFRQVFRAVLHRRFRADIACLAPFLPVDGWYLDVGAHHGRYTLELSRAHGGRCSVAAFEPTPYNQRVLGAVVRRRPNVTRFDVALSDRSATLALYTPIRSGRLMTGSSFVEDPEQLARQFDVVFHRGVLVQKVVPDSDLDLAPGSIIIEVNGETVSSTEEFIAVLRQQNLGFDVPITVIDPSGERNRRMLRVSQP